MTGHGAARTLARIGTDPAITGEPREEQCTGPVPRAQ